MTLQKGQIDVSNLQSLNLQDKINVKKGIGIESKVVTIKVNEQTKDEAVTQFNSLNPTVSIKDVSSFKIRANFTDFTVTPVETTTRIYTLISKPDNAVELEQGNYGASANQITANHLLIDYETQSSSQDIE